MKPYGSIRLALALAVGGLNAFAATPVAAQFIPGASKLLELLAPKPKAESPEAQQKRAEDPANVQAAQVAKPMSIMSTRPPAELRLLLGRRVTGDELITELKAIRRLMKLQRTTTALSELSGALDVQGGFNPLDIVYKPIESLMKDYSGGFSFEALDEFLRALTEETRTVKEVALDMPSAQLMSDAEVQRIVTMAALVVAAKASGPVLDRAKKDLGAIEEDFKRLIARRESAAALMYEVIAERRQAQRSADNAALARLDGQLGSVMSRQDINFVNADLTSLNVTQFANDMAAQNLALAYLRQADPAAWQDYQVQRDGVLLRTRAYIGAIGGVGAFGGLIVSFANEVAMASNGASISQILRLLPFALEFLKESPGLIQLAGETAGGVALDARKSLQRFRITTANGSENFSNAAGVVDALKKRQAEHLLAGSLFRTGAPGLLQSVHTCDAVGAGRMLDTLVPGRDRDAFKAGYFGSTGPSGAFSFVNAVAASAEGADSRLRDLPDQLLKTDHRGQRDIDDRVQAMGKVQQVASANAKRMTSEQLMRVIFANREGAAMQATLQLGEVAVRPIPSMDTVYAYESLVQACQSLVALPANQAPSRS